MNETIIKELTKELNIKATQINAVLNLLEEGATIPFIARYRKEVTGNLNEDEIRTIEESYRYQENLLKKKEDTIRLIEEKGLLTDEIKTNILNATKLAEIEDIYRPFKEKKKTKATEAIKAGLEPLAKKIMAFPEKGNMESLASGYNMDNRLESVTLISEIKLNDRKKVSLSGLKKLVSFDPEEFVMDTNLGPLVLKGNNLEIVKLDIIDGNLQIKGKINSLVYLDGKDSKKDNGILAKLFK